MFIIIVQNNYKVSGTPRLVSTYRLLERDSRFLAIVIREKDCLEMEACLNKNIIHMIFKMALKVFVHPSSALYIMNAMHRCSEH
jgi:hypothetical protein